MNVDAIIAKIARDEATTQYEKIYAYSEYRHVRGYKIADIAKLCKRSPSSISQYLAYHQFRPILKAAVKAGTIAVQSTRSFLKLDPEKDFIIYDRLVKALLDNKITCAEADKEIAAYLGAPAKDARRIVYSKNDINYRDPDVQKAMCMSRLPEAVLLLNYYTEEFNFSSSQLDRRYYRGILDGIEMLCGIRSAPIK